MTAYETRLEYPGANRLGRDALLAICRCVEKFISADNTDHMDVSLTLNFADNHVIKGADFEDLLNDQFLTSKPLIHFEVSGTNYRTKRQMSVDLASSYGNPIKIRIGGDRDACILARGEIENVIEGTREWYTPIMPRDSFGYYALVIPGMFCVLFVGMLVTQARLGWIDISKGQDFANVFFESGLLAIFFSWARRRLFPAVVFDIGKSGMMASNRDAIRNLVLVGIGLGLVIGVAGSIIANKIPI